MENTAIGNSLSQDEPDEKTRVALNKIHAFVHSLGAKLPESRDYGQSDFGQNDPDRGSSVTSGS
jgi:hypothetical protein